MATEPSIALIPSGYKTSKIFSELPSNGNGDFNFYRSGIANKLNKDGLIEEVANNIPRLNYLNSDCPSLLLEPVKTNQLQRSEEFENAYWINNGVTVTANNTIAPNGTLTADLLTGVSGGFGVIRFSTWNATNNVASCFVKKQSTSLFKIENVSGIGGVEFNIETGLVVSESSGFESKIEYYGEGWYRCTAIDTLARSGTFSLSVTSINDSVNIWGCQLEANYLTSYIKTESSAITRNAESFSKTGLSSNINSLEGVLYIEMASLTNDSSASNRAITINGIGGSTSNLVTIRFEPALNTIIAIFGKSGEPTLTITRVLSDVTDFNKIAFTWKKDSFNLWNNGIKIGSLNSGNVFTVGTLDEINSNIGNGTQSFSGKIKDLRVYENALSDAELTTLTTL